MDLRGEGEFAGAQMRHHRAHAGRRNVEYVDLGGMLGDERLGDDGGVGERPLGEPQHHAFSAALSRGAKAHEGILDQLG